MDMASKLFTFTLSAEAANSAGGSHHSHPSRPQLWRTGRALGCRLACTDVSKTKQEEGDRTSRETQAGIGHSAAAHRGGHNAGSVLVHAGRLISADDTVCPRPRCLGRDLLFAVLHLRSSASCRHEMGVSRTVTAVTVDVGIGGWCGCPPVAFGGVGKFGRSALYCDHGRPRHD